MATEQNTGPWVIADSRDTTARRYLKNVDNGGWKPEWTSNAHEAHQFTVRIDMLVVDGVLTRQGVYVVCVLVADVLDVHKAA